jgi:eukaryotic translation initiation factor 2C
MKLGGVNHVLDERNIGFLRKSPTLIVGADVTQ